MYSTLRRLRVLLSSAQDITRATRYVTRSKMPQKTIEDFGYIFNKDGYLRKLDPSGKPTEQSFTFNISDNHQECQQNYEDLGDAVTEHVYRILESEEKLTRLPVPEGTDDQCGTFVFVSRGYEKKDKLLVLIHGSGVVRAGQWARSLIINDNLHTGSQIPYIRRGLNDGFGILIMNTNDNYRTVDSKPTKIPNSGSSTEHAYYVWEKYIAPSKSKYVAIVAHSYGGLNTVELANKYKDFEERVKAVAFTDSVHGFANSKVTKHLKQVGRNWVASVDPIDQLMTTPDYDITRVSAGHRKHEMTSASAMESVFKFISEKIV